MGCATLEITVQYAEDLNKVNFISKMDVYVVVSISGGDEASKQKTKTVVDHGGDANPTWSFPMKFAVEEAALLQNRLVLDFYIKCERALVNRLIGEVHVPVKELLDFPAKGHGGAATKNFVSYQVKKPDGRPKGKLTFSYQFHGKTAASSMPPPPPPAAAAALHGSSTIAYPVVEPISPYLVMAAGGYSPFQPESAAAEYTPSYVPAALGVYPPNVPPQPAAVSPEVCEGQYPPPPSYLPDCSMIKPEWYPPPPLPPPCFVSTPQGYFGHSPPVMQLAPDWWIVDWRYDTRCSGF
ncbi:protein SRC2-like [Salvia miltiorrhiza]|uniref:protein SRC2-like n=1 Tax=Salvia miltiorrhiza TaxID=226208 RepID=UPI0025ACFDA4|nr:protein SRC2-like [Salvia miltiorrhiza]